MIKRFISRFTLVKITNKGDIHFGKKGVIVTIARLSIYPYRICFGCDRCGDGIIGVYHEGDFVVVRRREVNE